MAKRNVKPAEFEWIIHSPEQSFRWQEHDYPAEICRWNYHPDFELHLINSSCGKQFVGDSIRDFVPGQIVLVGPNVPHDWVSDLAPGEVVQRRSTVIQFNEDLLTRATATFPEFRELDQLLADAHRGIEFHGQAAAQAGALVRRIGQIRPGLRQMLMFVQVLLLLAESRQRTLLSSEAFVSRGAKLDDKGADVIHESIRYILENLSDGVSMAYAAERAGMSESAFSRFFKRGTGHNFVQCVRQLRIAKACRLLRDSDMPVTDICFHVGYRNLSNFNQHFHAERGMTPSAYRRLAAENALRDDGELAVAGLGASGTRRGGRR